MLEKFVTYPALKLALDHKVEGQHLMGLIPEAQLFANAIAPRNPVRDVYHECRDSNGAITTMEKFVVGRKLFAYRSLAVKGVIHRDLVTFEPDNENRVLATWAPGQGRAPFKGYFYCAAERVFGSLTKKRKKHMFEMAFMCIDWDIGRGMTIMPGMFLGLTDAGDSPCSGRLVVVDVTDRQTNKGPGVVESKEWPQTQRKNLMKYFDPRTRVLTGEHALMCKRDFLSQYLPADAASFIL